jgi:hypothetical protein
MFATNRRSTMFALACATMAAMMSVGATEARASGLPGSAQAEIVLYDTATSTLSVENGALVFSTSGGGIYTASLNVTVGNFRFSATVETTNTPGGNPSILDLSNVNITNTSGTTDTLNFTVSATGYTQPPSPVFMDNSISGTALIGTTSTAFTSYLDQTNALASVTGTGLYSGPFTASLNSTSGVTGSNNQGLNGPSGLNATGSFFTYSGSMFSMSESGSATITGNGEANPIGWGTNVFLATPAPSSALLAVAGMPVLGLAWMVRRRRSRVEGAAIA